MIGSRSLSLLLSAAMCAAGGAAAAETARAALDRPVSETELRELAAAYSRGDLGSGRCDWVHPVSDGPTRIPCEVVPLPVLAKLADNVMNKHAQLELGKRLEEGRGVPQDLELARRYYRMASRDAERNGPIVEGTLAGFQVGVGGHAIFGRPRASGLPEAEERLRKLAARN